MSKFIDELHNKEDSGSFADAILFFLGLSAVLFALGVVFWVGL